MRPTAPPVWFLALATAIGVVGLTILTPILPMMKTELGVSSVAVQRLLTYYMIALALGQLVFGPVSDRFGRRPVLLLGASLFTIGAIAATIATTIDGIIASRVVQGCGAAACMSMCKAIVNDAFDRSEAARQMSMISIVLSIAPVMSIAFGGVLASATGWVGTMFLLSFLGAIVIVSAWFLGAETNLAPQTQINIRSIAIAYKTVLRNRLFFFWTLASGLQIGIFFSLNSVLGYQFLRNGHTLAEFGLWFSLTPLFYLIGNTCNRKWFVYRGIERAAMIGCSGSLVAMVALFITQFLGMTHPLSIALPCCLFGFSNGITVANTTIGAISASGKHIGTGSGIVGAWQMASGAVAGAIIIALGGDEVFLIAAGFIIVMAGISVASMLVVYKAKIGA